jgi:Mg2+ and Co2+ transporter CorA
MATTHTPIIGGPFDFEIITGIMALLALIMLAMFKRKKWL